MFGQKAKEHFEPQRKLFGGIATKAENHMPCTLRSFKTPLYELTSFLYRVPRDWFKEIAACRDRKDKFEPKLGCTPREALIFVSERVVKPNFGDSWFGEYAADSLVKGHCHFFTDSGFYQETLPLFAKADVMLVQIYREGCSFEGDSRGYLSPDDFSDFFELQNNGTIDEALEVLLPRIDQFLGQK